MDKQPKPYWINCSLTLSSKPEHYLRRESNGKGKLKTACGGPEYRDGMGRPRRGQRDAYKVVMGCRECNAWLNEVLRQHEREERRSLYDHGSESKDSVRSDRHLRASPDCTAGYEGLDEPCVGVDPGAEDGEGKPLTGSGYCDSVDVLGNVSSKGEMMAQNRPEPEPTTEEGQIAQLLDRVNKTMVSLWGPLPLADKLCGTKDFEKLGARLRSHQIGAIPLLREISTELQCKLDTLVRLKYNIDTAPQSEPRPKKG